MISDLAPRRVAVTRLNLPTLSSYVRIFRHSAAWLEISFAGPLACENERRKGQRYRTNAMEEKILKIQLPACSDFSMKVSILTVSMRG